MALTPRLDQLTQDKQETGPLKSDDKTNAQVPAGVNSSKLKVASKIAKPAAQLSIVTKSGSEEVDHCSLLTPLGKFQPSKLFISKCQSEADSLLESIRDKFHEDIKNLLNDELYTDLTVNIGENFKKSLHKCLIASRAFKLYTALKPFRRQEFPIEKDIIISEFQNLSDDSQTDQEPPKNSGEKEKGKEEEAEAPVVEEPLLVTCDLPDDLLSPELFSNFIRRVYLNTDISEEDFKLNQQIVSWLKVHKPETIRPPRATNCSPDHKESFRTILPNFDEIHCTPAPAMSSREGETVPCNDEPSPNNSLRDESFTGSSLTRTETFELIRSNLDKPGLCSPGKATDNEDDADAKVSETEEAQVPYAPTTRTGLKPKKFTTPKELPLSNRVKEGSQTALKNRTRDEAVKAKPSIPTSSRNTAAPTKQRSVADPKRLSQGSTISASSSDAQPTRTPQCSGPKASTPVASTNKNKTSLITRAYPISMERSQSPSTNLLRSSGRNFMAANKRIVAKTDKKVTPTQGDSIAIDSENETSDTSSFVLEPISTDNLAAQLDKLTLVSQSSLADCLSKLFVNESLSDVIINTSHNKRLNAHKCILAARSAFLADLFCKQGTSQNTAEVAQAKAEVDLTEFSFQAVYFAVLHMYSGIVKVPDDLDLSELAGLNHLLHVNTLRQVCIHNLRMNYCHFFHKPCNVCCLGVLKTLPVAWRYDYQELYTKCLQWVGSHFAIIFCLKEFADLRPHDLLEECYKATLSQLTQDNIIPKTIECQKLLKNLPRVKWTESIICLVGRLLEDFCHYVADNYEKILQSESFHNLSKNCWECEILEENLLAAMNHLKPDMGCKTLIQLHKIECSNESFNDSGVSDSFDNLVTKMRKYCERYLLKEATAVVHCNSWRHMSPSLQKRIKDQAIIATDFDEPSRQLASKPKLPSMSRNTRQQLSSSPANGTSSDSGSKSPNYQSDPRLKSPNSYLPPPKNKTAAARHVKVLK